MSLVVKKLTPELKENFKKDLEIAFIKKYGSNYHSYTLFGLDDIDYYSTTEKHILGTIIEDNELKSFFIYENISTEKIIQDFEMEMDNYSEDEANLIYQYISDIDNNGIYINYIESFENGYGTLSINKLKELNSKIMLYADYEACEFWDKSDFLKVFGYTYIYPKKAIKELFYNPSEYEDIAWTPGVKF